MTLRTKATKSMTFREKVCKVS